jgi:hypothetical protein
MLPPRLRARSTPNFAPAAIGGPRTQEYWALAVVSRGDGGIDTVKRDTLKAIFTLP